MSLNFTKKDSNFFKLKFEHTIEKILRYYIYNGFNTGELFKLCFEVINESISNLENSLEKTIKSNEFVSNYASILVSFPYTEELEFKRGEVVGIDSKGYVLIKVEPGWIPRHPYIKRDTNLDYETWAVIPNLEL